MMKILIIINVIDSGGSSTLLRAILNHLDYKKYQVEILTFEKNVEYEKLIPKEVIIRHVYKNSPELNGNKVIRCVYTLYREFVPKWFINKFVIKNKYDVAIDFKGINLNVLTACKCPTVLWSQKDYSPITNPIEKEWIDRYSKSIIGRIKTFLFKNNLRKIDHVVCLSEAMKQGFINRWFYTKPIHVIRNIIDAEYIRKLSYEQIPFSRSNEFTFCCMSRIAKGKGIERFLECVEALNNLGYKYKTIIVGGGIAFGEIRELFKKMNLSNVHLLGHQNNPYPYVKKSDVFVCPTETESYGLAFCEAVVIGTPVIMTNVGVAAEVLNGDKYGLLVDNSKDGIFKAMKKFLDEPDLVKKYQNNDIEGNAIFDWHITMAEVEKLFNEFSD